MVKTLLYLWNIHFCRTTIKPKFIYFNLCLSLMLEVSPVHLYPYFFLLNRNCSRILRKHWYASSIEWSINSTYLLHLNQAIIALYRWCTDNHNNYNTMFSCILIGHYWQHVICPIHSIDRKKTGHETSLIKSE